MSDTKTLNYPKVKEPLLNVTALKICFVCRLLSELHPCRALCPPRQCNITTKIQLMSTDNMALLMTI